MSEETNELRQALAIARDNASYAGLEASKLMPYGIQLDATKRQIKRGKRLNRARVLALKASAMLNEAHRQILIYDMS